MVHPGHLREDVGGADPDAQLVVVVDQRAPLLHQRLRVARRVEPQRSRVSGVEVRVEDPALRLVRRRAGVVGERTDAVRHDDRGAPRLRVPGPEVDRGGGGRVAVVGRDVAQLRHGSRRGAAGSGRGDRRRQPGHPRSRRGLRIHRHVRVLARGEASPHVETQVHRLLLVTHGRVRGRCAVSPAAGQGIHVTRIVAAHGLGPEAEPGEVRCEVPVIRATVHVVNGEVGPVVKDDAGGRRATTQEPALGCHVAGARRCHVHAVGEGDVVDAADESVVERGGAAGVDHGARPVGLGADVDGREIVPAVRDHMLQRGRPCDGDRPRLIAVGPVGDGAVVTLVRPVVFPVVDVVVVEDERRPGVLVAGLDQHRVHVALLPETGVHTALG